MVQTKGRKMPIQWVTACFPSPPLAESQKVFREPLGDHLSNSVAGSLPLPPRGPIQTSLPLP